jgi:phospholipase C
LFVAISVFAASFVSACSQGSTLPPTKAPAQKPPPGVALIKHIVIIVQENRSFDNMFNGFPGADTAQSGLTHDGKTIPLQPLGLGDKYDIFHGRVDFVAAYDNGKNDGFDLEGLPSGAPPYYMYGYVQQSEVQPYWTLAQSYVLADRMFQSNNNSSFPAHQYLIAGQANGAISGPRVAPWGCDSPAGDTVMMMTSNGSPLPNAMPCFDYGTLADLMDAKGVSWRYYAPAVGVQGYIWSAYDAIRHIRDGADWDSHVVSPETTILQDVAGGSLPSMTWVVPNWVNSDHGGNLRSSGPDWVASVVDAIGQSSLWSSTAIFVTWDDWGGWYDHVPPTEHDALGPGFRVPLIVISPYARTGYVSHVDHDFGSLLRFAEETLGLPSLGQDDARADDLSDCFDFSQQPRPFVFVHTRMNAADFLVQPRSLLPPDD